MLLEKWCVVPVFIRRWRRVRNRVGDRVAPTGARSQDPCRVVGGEALGVFGGPAGEGRRGSEAAVVGARRCFVSGVDGQGGASGQGRDSGGGGGLRGLGGALPTDREQMRLGDRLVLRVRRRGDQLPGEAHLLAAAVVAGVDVHVAGSSAAVSGQVHCWRILLLEVRDKRLAASIVVIAAVVVAAGGGIWLGCMRVVRDGGHQTADVAGRSGGQEDVQVVCFLRRAAFLLGLGRGGRRLLGPSDPSVHLAAVLWESIQWLIGLPMVRLLLLLLLLGLTDLLSDAEVIAV